MLVFGKVTFYGIDPFTGTTHDIFHWNDHFSEISYVDPMKEKKLPLDRRRCNGRTIVSIGTTSKVSFKIEIEVH